MNKIVPYEIAYLAKQKGFNEEIDNIYCLGQWDAERQVIDDSFKAPKNSEMCGEEACSAPTYLELKEWLEKRLKKSFEEKPTKENIKKTLKILPNVDMERPQELLLM